MDFLKYQGHLFCAYVMHIGLIFVHKTCINQADSAITKTPGTAGDITQVIAVFPYALFPRVLP